MALTIGSLLEGRARPVSVKQTDGLNTAIEMMLRQDYTQLPVTDDRGKLVGMVTSDSILRASDALGLLPKDLSVADAMVRTRSFDPDGDVAELLNALRDQYAALVVDGDGVLKGVITGYDASEYFRGRSEDLMLVEDIESSIKEHIRAAFQDETGRVDPAKLDEAAARIAGTDKSVKSRLEKAIRLYATRALGVEVNGEICEQVVAETAGSKPQTFEQLTMSGYIDILLHSAVWSHYGDVFGIDVHGFRQLLNSVRDTRNALAHFRGEISAIDRGRLEFCARWLERHPPRRRAQVPVPPTSAPSNESPDVVPVDEDIEPGEGKYAKLAVWLQRANAAQDQIQLTFAQIEEIVGSALPPSARDHRSWWANDSVSHPQSRQWLEVGWRVAAVSINDETVTFWRIVEREAAYIGFFSELMARLERAGVLPLRSMSPSGLSWHNLVRLPDAPAPLGWLVCSFARGSRLRVEFYIDSGDKAANKELFDFLSSERTDIEQEFGSPLSWERLDEKRASRIAIYHAGAITDAAELPALVEWAADAVTRLHGSLAKRVSAFTARAEPN